MPGFKMLDSRMNRPVRDKITGDGGPQDVHWRDDRHSSREISALAFSLPIRTKAQETHVQPGRPERRLEYPPSAESPCGG